MKTLSANQVKERYNKIAKYYDLIEWLFEILLIAKLRKKLLQNARGNVLEIGIGTGNNLGYYSKDCRITGIDISKEMLKIANEKAKKLGINIKLKEGNVENIKLKEKYDFIIDALGFCTYSKPIDLLKKLKKTLKDNGKIILLEHGLSDNETIRKLQYWREPKHYKLAGCTLLRNYLPMLKNSGLKIEKHERHFFGIVYAFILKR